jgi:hypothetical protein
VDGGVGNLNGCEFGIKDIEMAQNYIQLQELLLAGLN